MKKTPLVRVNEEFGGKEKLVDTIVDVAERGDEDKAALRKRLLAASNTKLMRLLRIATEVKQIGGKEKLVDAILAQSNRAKDKDYRARLMVWSPGRLLDLHHARARTSPPAPAPTRKTTGKKKGKAA